MKKLFIVFLTILSLASFASNKMRFIPQSNSDASITMEILDNDLMRIERCESRRCVDFETTLNDLDSEFDALNANRTRARRSFTIAGGLTLVAIAAAYFSLGDSGNLIAIGSGICGFGFGLTGLVSGVDERLALVAKIESRRSLRNAVEDFEGQITRGEANCQNGEYLFTLEDRAFDALFLDVSQIDPATRGSLKDS